MSRKRKANDAPGDGRSLSDEQDNSNAPNMHSNSDHQQNTDPPSDARNTFSPPGQQAGNFLSVAQLMNMLQAQNNASHSQPNQNPLSILFNSFSTDAGRTQSHSHSQVSQGTSHSNFVHESQSNAPSTQDALHALMQILTGQAHQNQMMPNHHAAGMPFTQQRPTDAVSLLSTLQILGMLQNQGQSATAYQQPNAFLTAAHIHNQRNMQNPSQNRQTESATRQDSAAASNVKATSHAPFTLYMSCDDGMLSEYQCLIRKHIELFEATDKDICTIGQGRNRRVHVGQVGVRCKHCRHIPQLARTKGAVYFPFKAENVYQACQNMAAVHLCDNCPNIPASTKIELQRLAKEPKSTAGGGKRYWSEGVRAAGIVEDAEGRLRFGEED